jgi:hypothetical protein
MSFEMNVDGPVIEDVRSFLPMFRLLGSVRMTCWLGRVNLRIWLWMVVRGIEGEVESQ